MRDITAIILTYNSGDRLADTIAAAKIVADEIFVVDSFSTDGTVDLAKASGADVVQHEFVHYGAQRNWAIESLPISTKWELHLDADEVISSELASEISALPDDSSNVSGYAIPRLIVFMGREIRHGGMWPLYHLRLFRRGFARCENRLYDQHFYLTDARAKVGTLTRPMVDNVCSSLVEWTEIHTRWAQLQAIDEMRTDAALRSLPRPMKRVRRGKAAYMRMPLAIRAWLLFLYRYFLRRGFLDGREGLVFFTLQTLWFRALVDGLLLERKSDHRGDRPRRSLHE